MGSSPPTSGLDSSGVQGAISIPCVVQIHAHMRCLVLSKTKFDTTGLNVTFDSSRRSFNSIRCRKYLRLLYNQHRTRSKLQNVLQSKQCCCDDGAPSIVAEVLLLKERVPHNKLCGKRQDLPDKLFTSLF